MKKLTYLFIICFIASESQAQITLDNGLNVIEISGSVSTYGNYRFYKDGQTNFKKNRFKLRDAQLKIEGRKGNDWEYELQFDLADVIAGANDPENPPIRDAFFIYKKLPIDIKAGFQKIPYSFASMVPFNYSPYFHRPEFLRGEILGRRDVGVTLMKDFWNGRINVFAGAYTGLAEFSLGGDNDAAGHLEYVGRVEIGFPTKFKYRMIDINHSPIPMFMLGINARTSISAENRGSNYQLLTVDGQRDAVGIDFQGMYKGFSFTVEAHQLKVTPNDTLRLYDFLEEKSFLAGSFNAQLAYHFKKLKTTISGRYEHYNLNSLYKGYNERLNFAAAYHIDRWNSVIKAQFWHILEEEVDLYTDDINWTQQIRLGWVFQFK